VRAVSNLVDVTNLVLLLFGQPLHAFDLALVRGRTIVVRRARPGERMTTLDGVERAFAPEDLLICDGEGPVAAAGVMGGEASGVRPETSEVLIECAHFDPRSIRRTSRRLGLASESSYRFERGTDRGGVPEALACAAGLMVELGGGKACGEPIDVGGPGPAPAPVRLRPARVARIVGRDYPAAGIAGMLGSLGCRTTTAADGTIDVLAPSWRQDLGREIDLVEEIARLDGYGAVPTTVPAVAPGPRRRGNWERLARVRGVLVARGLAEAVNHVFVEADVLAAFGAAQDECVRLRNPLDVTRAHLRTTLLPGLLADVRTAFARREASAALFEIGRTFHRREGAEAPEEVWRLGIVLAGCRPGWLAGGGEAFDLYDAAGALEAVAAGALRAPLALRAAAQGLPMLHPRAACVVEIGGGAAGLAGELHPLLADRLGVPRGAIVAEVDLRPERCGPAVRPVRELPRFPAVRRDVALIGDAGLRAGDVAAAARELGPSFLESVTVFDVYEGKQIPAGRKSMAFALLYRAADRTLTDEEVDGAHAGIVDGLVARFGVTIRR
jgi:phenylalanyl-tRNA synthetase beta chain